MLNKFDIIAFKRQQGNQLSLGVAKNDSDKEHTVIEVAELAPEATHAEAADGDKGASKIWKISKQSKIINKKNIILKLNQIKYINKNSQFGHGFGVKLSGFDIQKILMEFEVKKRHEKINLKKRVPRTRGRGKKAGKKLKTENMANFYEEFKFEVGASPSKIFLQKQRRILPSFMRTATTNLRFSLPGSKVNGKKAGEEQDSALPNPSAFLSRRFKSQRQTVLKTLSQDLNLIFDAEEVTKLKFIDVCQTVLKEIDSRYGKRMTGNRLDLGLASKEYVNVPTKEEMKKTLHYFVSFINFADHSAMARSLSGVVGLPLGALTGGEGPQDGHISAGNGDSGGGKKEKVVPENGEGGTQKLIYLIISYIFCFSLRFFMSHKTSRLHLLKNKMYIDKFEDSDPTTISTKKNDNSATNSDLDRLCSLLSSLKKFIETLKNLLDDTFTNDYLDLCSSIGTLIGLRSETSIDSDQNLNKTQKLKIKKFLADFSFDLINELMLLENSEPHIINIFASMINSINVTPNFSVKNKQGVLVRRLSAYYNNRINHTNKKWNLFVDSCCQFLRERKMEEVRALAKNYANVSATTQRMLAVQTSIAKGLLVAVLTVVLDEQIKSSADTAVFSEEMNNFLDSLLDSSEKLPILIYFIQGMSRIHGDIEELAKSCEIKALDTFIQKFMFESGLDQANNIKLFGKNYQQSVEEKNRLFFVLGNEKKDDDVWEFLKEGLVKKDAALLVGGDGGSGNGVGDVQGRFNVWLTLINEFYTSYLIEEEFKPRERLIAAFDAGKKALIESGVYSEAHLKLMELIIKNFQNNPKNEIKENGDEEAAEKVVYSPLSIQKGDSEDTLYLKMTIVSFMALSVCFEHDLISKPPSDTKDSWFYKRQQLAALPGKAEEKYLLIANVFYSLDSNWRSGQQFTKLYQCTCGYLYWIGDCGRAWVIGKCPSCGRDIGGTSHNLVNSETVEITKDHFFDKMYGPLEEISSKIYQVRDLGGKYLQLPEKTEKDEEKTNEAKNETDNLMEATEEKVDQEETQQNANDTAEGQQQEGEEDHHHHPTGGDNEPEAAPKNSGYLPVRFLDTESHFKLVEFISHSRYLLDWLTEPGQELKEGMKKFIRLEKNNEEKAPENGKEEVKNDNKGDDELLYQQYFFDVLENAYKRIKTLEFKDTSKEMFFRGINIFLTEHVLSKLIYNGDESKKRNDFEKLIKNEFDIFKPEFSSRVTQRLEMKKEMDGNLSNSSRLVKNWVNRMASISEFKKKNSDIQIISGMRMDKDIDISKLKDYLNSRLKKEEQKIAKIQNGQNGEIEAEEAQNAAPGVVDQVSEGNPKLLIRQIKFLMNIIGLEPILRNFKKMIFSHIDFCNYLQQVFDYRLTYRLACSISIKDLLDDDEPQTDENTALELEDPNNDPQGNKAAAAERRFAKKRLETIKNNKGDITLITKFFKLKEAWDIIMKYREEFGDIFDFRFLCHATEMPQEKIDEIFEPATAKLIYFLPNEKYVESLFMASSLQTLANIQNKVITDSKAQYFRANYCKPGQMSVQEARKGQLMGMSTSFENVIKKCSFANLRFNKDSEMVYNIDMMERELAIDLFFGSQLLSFEGEFIQNFSFFDEFSEVANSVATVSSKFGQTFLDAEETAKLAQCCEISLEETYAIFARKLKELGHLDFDLSLIKEIRDEKDQFVLDFESELVAQNNGGDDQLESEGATKRIVGLLNEVGVTLNHIKFVYEFLEERMFEVGVQGLDPVYDVQISDETAVVVREALKGLEDEEIALVAKVAKCVTLRQLVGTTNENIGKTALAMGLEYSGVLGDDEELNEQFLGKLTSAGLLMHHLVSFIRLIDVGSE